MNILVDGWRQAGVAAVPYLIPRAQQGDNEVRSTFPALGANRSTLADPLNKLTTAEIARAERRWAGVNAGAWSHAEFDRLYDAFNTTLNHGERGDFVAQAMKIVSEELPLLTIYYSFEIMAHVTAMAGPTTVAPGTDDLWNMHEWTWR